MRVRSRFVASAFLWALLLPAMFAQETAKGGPNFTSESTSASAEAYRAPDPDFGALLPKDKAPRSTDMAGERSTPAAELFGGYSYLRFNPRPNGSAQTFDNHGGTASIAGNVNNWLGLVADFGFYKVSGDLQPGSSGKAQTYLFGPRFSHRGERWTPFASVLFGAARMSVDSSTPVVGSNNFFNNSVHKNAFATAFGAGFDYTLTRHVAWRVVQAEYLITKFPDGNNNFQNNLRLATGLVFRFGGNPPPNHPPVIAVSTNPNTVVEGSGDSTVVQAKASDPDKNDTLTYTWTATGGKIEGTGPEVRWNSQGVAPGKYTITGTVNDGRGGSASASTDVTVTARPNRPPTVTCGASPKSVIVGQPVTVTATGSDPDGDNLTYTFDASSGKVTGSGASGQFDTTGLAPGHYTVNCHADDGKGGKADGSTDIEVQPKPVVITPEQKQLEVRLSLHSIYFATAKPTAVNPTGGLVNSQERSLVMLASDFKKYLSYKPDAHLILQGHADPRGTAEYNKLLTDRRVERTKAFLVEQGVAADHIDTQGLGEEQPMSVDQVKQAIDADTNISPEQKKQLATKAAVLALAQSRRVDVTLSTTGQTSTRQFPFNAEDALNLINPKGTGTAKAKTGTGAKKPATAPKTGAPATKKAPTKKQ
jgi:outer membrane protein OmpA-like peptidoglycan-associated protein